MRDLVKTKIGSKTPKQILSIVLVLSIVATSIVSFLTVSAEETTHSIIAYREHYTMEQELCYVDVGSPVPEFTTRGSEPEAWRDGHRTLLNGASIVYKFVLPANTTKVLYASAWSSGNITVEFSGDRSTWVSAPQSGDGAPNYYTPADQSFLKRTGNNKVVYARVTGIGAEGVYASFALDYVTSGTADESEIIVESPLMVFKGNLKTEPQNLIDDAAYIDGESPYNATYMDFYGQNFRMLSWNGGEITYKFVLPPAMKSVDKLTFYAGLGLKVELSSDKSSWVAAPRQSADTDEPSVYVPENQGFLKNDGNPNVVYVRLRPDGNVSPKYGSFELYYTPDEVAETEHSMFAYRAGYTEEQELSYIDVGSPMSAFTTRGSEEPWREGHRTLLNGAAVVYKFVLPANTTKVKAASAYASGGITVEFSGDRSTWVSSTKSDDYYTPVDQTFLKRTGNNKIVYVRVTGQGAEGVYGSFVLDYVTAGTASESAVVGESPLLVFKGNVKTEPQNLVDDAAYIDGESLYNATYMDFYGQNFRMLSWNGGEITYKFVLPPDMKSVDKLTFYAGLGLKVELSSDKSSWVVAPRQSADTDEPSVYVPENQGFLKNDGNPNVVYVRLRPDGNVSPKYGSFELIYTPAEIEETGHSMIAYRTGYTMEQELGYVDVSTNVPDFTTWPHDDWRKGQRTIAEGSSIIYKFVLPANATKVLSANAYAVGGVTVEFSGDKNTWISSTQSESTFTPEKQNFLQRTGNNKIAYVRVTGLPGGGVYGSFMIEYVTAGAASESAVAGNSPLLVFKSNTKDNPGILVDDAPYIDGESTYNAQYTDFYNQYFRMLSWDGGEITYKFVLPPDTNFVDQLSFYAGVGMIVELSGDKNTWVSTTTKTVGDFAIYTPENQSFLHDNGAPNIVYVRLRPDGNGSPKYGNFELYYTAGLVDYSQINPDENRQLVIYTSDSGPSDQKWLDPDSVNGGGYVKPYTQEWRYLDAGESITYKVDFPDNIKSIPRVNAYWGDFLVIEASKDKQTWTEFMSVKPSPSANGYVFTAATQDFLIDNPDKVVYFRLTIMSGAAQSYYGNFIVDYKVFGVEPTVGGIHTENWPMGGMEEDGRLLRQSGTTVAENETLKTAQRVLGADGYVVYRVELPASATKFSLSGKVSGTTSVAVSSDGMRFTNTYEATTEENGQMTVLIPESAGTTALAESRMIYIKIFSPDGTGKIADLQLAYDSVAGHDVQAPVFQSGSFAVTDTTDHSASFVWPMALDDMTLSSEITYRIYRSDAPITQENLSGATLAATVKGTTAGSVLGLTENNSYYFALTAIDAAGNEALMILADPVTIQFDSTPDPDGTDYSQLPLDEEKELRIYRDTYKEGADEPWVDQDSDNNATYTMPYGTLFRTIKAGCSLTYRVDLPDNVKELTQINAYYVDYGLIEVSSDKTNWSYLISPTENPLDSGYWFKPVTQEFLENNPEKVLYFRITAPANSVGYFGSFYVRYTVYDEEPQGFQSNMTTDLKPGSMEESGRLLASSNAVNQDNTTVMAPEGYNVYRLEFPADTTRFSVHAGLTGSSRVAISTDGKNFNTVFASDPGAELKNALLVSEEKGKAALQQSRVIYLRVKASGENVTLSNLTVEYDAPVIVDTQAPTFNGDITVHTDSGSEASLRWKNAYDDKCSISQITYKIYYGKEPITEENLKDCTLGATTLGTTSAVIKDLKAGTYYIAVTATDPAGNTSLLTRDTEVISGRNDQVLDDPLTGITAFVPGASLPDGVLELVLDAAEVTNGAAYNRIEATFDDSDKEILLYRVQLLSQTGDYIDPIGDYVLRFPTPEKFAARNGKLYWYNVDEERLEEITPEKDGDMLKLTFKRTGYFLFAMGEETNSSEMPGTGVQIPTVILGLFACALISSTLIIAKRRRRAGK